MRMPPVSFVTINFNIANFDAENGTAAASDSFNDLNFDNLAFRTGGLTRSVFAQDWGLGTDSTSYYRLVEWTDSGVGIETAAWVLQSNFAEINFNLANFWAQGGSPVCPIGSYSFFNFWTGNFMCDGAYVNVVDSGLATETILSPIAVIVTDYAVAVDIAYRVQNELSIDGLPLPHVQGVTVREPTIVKTSPINDSLPKRRQIGKMGREMTVDGWAESLADLEAIKNIADGLDHRIMLPTGDGFMAHVIDADPLRNPNDDFAGKYRYSLRIVERVDVV
jgi:hypothetical protein